MTVMIALTLNKLRDGSLILTILWDGSLSFENTVKNTGLATKTLNTLGL